MIHIVPILKDNYCYLLEGDDGACIIVDPGQVSPVRHKIAQLGLKPVLILNTHHHADHIAGNAELKKLYGVPVTGPTAEAAKIPGMDHGVSEGDIIAQSGITLTVLDTPGHTAGHISFFWENIPALLCGDTLFSMGCGRLFEGTAADLYASLQKFKTLPPETMMYCGHEYTESNGAFAREAEPDNAAIKARLEEARKLVLNNRPTLPVTLARELETNPFLRAQSLNDFADLRVRKDTF